MKNDLTVVAENAMIKIVDIAGRTIASTFVNGQTTISAQAWGKGVYTAIVLSEQGEEVFKIIK